MLDARPSSSFVVVSYLPEALRQVPCVQAGKIHAGKGDLLPYGDAGPQAEDPGRS